MSSWVATPNVSRSQSPITIEELVGFVGEAREKEEKSLNSHGLWEEVRCGVHMSSTYTIFGLMKNKEGRRIKGENRGEKWFPFI